MDEPIEADRPPLAASGADADRSLPQVPGPVGRKVLLFEFLVLIEYWISPLLFGVENYAGLWSEVGYLLFVGFIASLIGFVVLPLRHHLSAAFRAPHRRLAFYAAWAGAIVLGLFATNTFQFYSGNAGAIPSGVGLSWSTVYTPFGPWSSLTIILAPIQLSGTINAVVVAVLGLLGFLWASALVLGPLRPTTACPTPQVPASGWRARLAPLLAWGPFGLISGCPSCAPAYVAWLAMVAPGPASAGYAAIPLVPWIGLAGLLYLASFGLTLIVIGRSTRPPLAPLAGPEPEVGA
ncbi:MAG TPA: hypothetical protein VEY07_02195 [Thermoplasmata archaeon]|nr:hypothetical protein [Thermoplasmata archaeon]